MSLPAEISQDHVVAAAEYALGLGDAASRRAFEAELENSKALRDEVRGWDLDLAALGFLSEAKSPRTSGVRELEKRLFGAPVKQPDNSLPLRRAVAVAILAAAVVFVLMGQFMRSGTQPTHQGSSHNAQEIVK